MKLEKNGTKHIEEPNVYGRIARDHEIPIIKSVPKDEESAAYSFRSFARFRTQAEEMSIHSSHFRTMSEVYRAAFYLGMSIVYHYTMGDKQTARVSQYVDRTLQSYENTMGSFQKILALFKRGFYSDKELHNAMERLLSNITDEKLAGVLEEEMLRQIRTGSPFDSVMRRRGHKVLHLPSNE